MKSTVSKLFLLMLVFSSALASDINQIPNDGIRFGRKTSSANKVIDINKGLASNPQIRYNYGSSLWQYSVDGTTFKQFNLGTDISSGAASNNQVLTANGSGAATWASVSGVTNTYWSGYTTNAASWSTTSGTLANGTNSGGNAVTTRFSNGLTATAGASNVAGITFTPASSTAVYWVSAKFTGGSGTQSTAAAFSLTDGTNVITQMGSGATFNGGSLAIEMSGIYVPGTASAVTVKIQMASTTNSGSTTAIINGSLAGGSVISSVIEWTVVQIK